MEMVQMNFWNTKLQMKSFMVQGLHSSKWTI